MGRKRTSEEEARREQIRELLSKASVTGILSIRQAILCHKQITLCRRKQRANYYLQKSCRLAQGINLSSCSGFSFPPSFGSSVSRRSKYP